MMSTVSTSNGAGRKNIVVIGGGIQGSAVAYYLANNDRNTPINITILESEEIASAASGKVSIYWRAVVFFFVISFLFILFIYQFPFSFIN